MSNDYSEDQQTSDRIACKVRGKSPLLMHIWDQTHSSQIHFTQMKWLMGQKAGE